MSLACRRKVTTPGRRLEMVTWSEDASPRLRRTLCLSARTCLYSDSGFGPCDMSGRIPPAPVGGPEELIFPNGVSFSVSGSMYQHHWPSTTFHCVFTGMDRGFLSKPGNFTYSWALVKTVALVKL